MQKGSLAVDGVRYIDLTLDLTQPLVHLQIVIYTARDFYFYRFYCYTPTPRVTRPAKRFIADRECAYRGPPGIPAQHPAGVSMHLLKGYASAISTNRLRESCTDGITFVFFFFFHFPFRCIIELFGERNRRKISRRGELNQSDCLDFQQILDAGLSAVPV